MKLKDRGHDGKSAADILEEATHLLRMKPLLLAPYYFGSLPFILGLLYFWTDMSTGANAWRHCASASWGLTLLFIWMKTWQSVYARGVLARIRGEEPPSWGGSRILRVAGLQTAIQPWSFLILPAAFVILLPFPQALAFFENATLMGSGEEKDMGTVIKKSWRQASLWPMQNTLIIWMTSPFLLVFVAFLIFVLVPFLSSVNSGAPLFFLFTISAIVLIPVCPLGVVTALNIGVVLLLVPWLLKTLFDVETLFSISGAHIVNSSFVAVVLSVSYLCLDPLLKASYCLRCFYGESRHTGEDLKVELRSAARPSGVVVLFLLFLLCFCPFGKALAEPGNGGTPLPERSIQPRQLDSAVQSVLEYPEYSWRLPREKPPEIAGGHGLFYEFLDSIISALRNGWDAAKKGLVKVWNFIQDILSRIQPSFPKMDPPDGRWSSFSRAFIIIPLVCIISVVAFLAWRAWKDRRPRPAAAPVSVKPVPDITREDLDATALPEDGWLNLARDLIASGELRLALRALYLATLASLAHQEWITIARYKSDREYELELRRRSHTRPQLAMVFAENRSLFESSWYGLHEVTPATVQRFFENQERIRIDAQR